MGISTDGQVCFGIAFDEGVEFPWDDGWDGDEDEWWQYAVCGYENPFELYNAHGGWINGVKPPDDRVAQYYAAISEFKKTHPVMPITVVRHCSGNYPMYILAIPRTVVTASRGYPEEIEPGKMIVTDNDRKLLIEFCKQHGIEIDDEPKWWLSSMWW